MKNLKYSRSVKLLKALRMYWYFLRPNQQGDPFFLTIYSQSSSALGGRLNQQPEDAPSCDWSTQHAEDKCKKMTN